MVSGKSSLMKPVERDEGEGEDRERKRMGKTVWVRTWQGDEKGMLEQGRGRVRKGRGASDGIQAIWERGSEGSERLGKGLRGKGESEEPVDL